MENLRAGGVVQGGSTITEQFVKNAYVGDERTYTRKLREAVLAWQLEDRWTKDRILTAYLNTVYYGAGAYGVEAAARTYFHKHASAAHPQGGGAARRAAQVPLAPTRRPTDKEMATEQRNKVLQLMADQGYVSQGRADQLMASKLEVYKHPPASNKSLADYFVDYVTRAAHQALRLGQGLRRRPQGLTSIDMTWQQRGHRHHQEHHRAAGLRLQAVGGPRRHRPEERLHPHHGRRPRLQEAEVQPGLAGASASRARR